MPNDVEQIFIRKDDASGIPIYFVGLAIDPAVVERQELEADELTATLEVEVADIEPSCSGEASGELDDRAVELDLSVPEPGTDTMTRLNELLPAHWSGGNPIDILGDAPPVVYGEAVKAAVADVDGRLDQGIWRRAAFPSDFTQRSPNPGAPPTEHTEYASVYTETALYIGQNALMTALYVGGPLLLVALVVGSAISIIQAVTQVQEGSALVEQAGSTMLINLHKPGRTWLTPNACVKTVCASTPF